MSTTTLRGARLRAEASGSTALAVRKAHAQLVLAHAFDLLSVSPAAPRNHFCHFAFGGVPTCRDHTWIPSAIPIKVFEHVVYS